MFHLRALFSICLILFAGNIYGQVKITEDMKAFPADFRGHDPAELVKGLSGVFEDKASAPKSIHDKKIYGELTGGDLFAFSLSNSDVASGRLADSGISFFGFKYPLLNIKDFPEPQTKYLGGSGMGSGIGSAPSFASIDEIAPPYPDQKDIKTTWSTSYLPIKTEFAPGALQDAITGPRTVCAPQPADPEKPDCKNYWFYVPSPQIHYGLSFSEKQNFPLINLKDRYFNLASYKMENREAPGLVAWVDNGAQYRGGLPVFIVRLMPPYFATQDFSAEDPVEKKPHLAVRKIFYVELIGIWMYDRRTGEIISKTGGVADISAFKRNTAPKSLTEATLADSAPDSSNRTVPVKILSKEFPSYTVIARKKGVEGAVRLRVTFLATGEIGAISVVSGLPEGLTEQAVEAARKIKFKPATRDGKPINVVKMVEYVFTLF